MLQGMTVASPPDALMPSATSLQASALREETTTFAPNRASNSAEERPMPRLEPVTTATLPVRSNGVFFTAHLLFLSFVVFFVMAGLRPGHPRLLCGQAFFATKTWMPGTSPGMTTH